MPKVTCPKCGGDGALELHGVLLETYEFLKEEGPVTVAEMVKKTNFHGVPSTLSNRIMRLNQMGLVDSVRGIEGVKGWKYKIKNGNGKHAKSRKK